MTQNLPDFQNTLQNMINSRFSKVVLTASVLLAPLSATLSPNFTPSAQACGIDLKQDKHPYESAAKEYGFRGFKDQPFGPLTALDKVRFEKGKEHLNVIFTEDKQVVLLGNVNSQSTKPVASIGTSYMTGMPRCEGGVDFQGKIVSPEDRKALLDFVARNFPAKLNEVVDFLRRNGFPN